MRTVFIVDDARQKNGSFESLKLLERCGPQPKERHIAMYGALRQSRLSGQAAPRPMGFARGLVAFGSGPAV